MYDELIKRLRYLTKVYSICDNENTNEYRLAIEAADAIEELQKRVPKTPHGRLIDADAYRDEFMDCVYTLCRHDPDNYRANAIIDLFDDAPTIIEAEGEE